MGYKTLLLQGFRATGKSTAGREIAKRIGWDFIEMDPLIVEKSGKQSISEITEGGKNWVGFRKLEQDVLQELVGRSNVVVSTGGGLCVNNIVNPESGKTFGEENQIIIKDLINVCSVLFTAEDNVIEARIKEEEMKKAETTRPILNEQRAKELELELQQYSNNPEKQKEVMVKGIVADSMIMCEQRKPLYAAITNNVIDTGKMDLNETVNKVIEYLA